MKHKYFKSIKGPVPINNIHLSKEDTSVVNDFLAGLTSQELAAKMCNMERISPDNIVILSHNDPDGHCSGAAVKFIITDNGKEKIHNIDYSYDFNKINTELEKADVVYVTDLSLRQNSFDTLMELTEKNQSLIIWIDHHISSKDVKIDDKYKNRVYRFIHEEIGLSACALVVIYKYLFGIVFDNNATKDDYVEDITEFNHDIICPDIIRYVSLFDTYDRAMDIDFVYGIKATELNINTDFGRTLWRGLIKHPYEDHRDMENDTYVTGLDVSMKLIGQFISDGKIIHRYVDMDYHRMRQDQLIKLVFVDQNNTEKIVYAINANQFSQVFGHYYYEAAACIKYYQNDKGKYVYTMYSDINNNKKCINCAKFAKQYGGGGHPGSAGWFSDNNMINHWRGKTNKINLQ